MKNFYTPASRNTLNPKPQSLRVHESNTLPWPRQYATACPAMVPNMTRDYCRPLINQPPSLVGSIIGILILMPLKGRGFKITGLHECNMSL